MDSVCKMYTILKTVRYKKKHLVRSAFVGRAGFEPAKM